METGTEVNAAERFGLGLVVGKFLPPHRGHRFLIETALSRCERVVVIICGKPVDPIPPELRAGWLRELVPQAEVMLIDDRYDENDSRVWAENTMGWLGRAPDAVFTSEDYGERYAGLMGARHVMVDRARLVVPCSGTAVRQDPFAMWDFIDPPLREWFAKRIVIVGAESTGTTTLAMDLAAALDTEWVAEYGREYSMLKQGSCDANWRSEEFMDIVREQARREDAAARRANRILVCDTNSFATVQWHRRYMGTRFAELEAFAAACRADVYFLTGDEIPFEQDGLRDGEHLRHDMHRWFEEALTAQPKPWFLLRGSRETRLSHALEILDELRLEWRR
ncbi:AAA family ATPase [Luteolibacter sp. Populi]|uniref:AAA family ATPase n=1 Tax=Luteolibacter sp. Populi TaxID=3230487 RepID=UPI003466C864